MARSNEDTASDYYALGILLSIVFSITLAITLFAAGFFVCTLQPTTSILSRLFSNFEQSAFLPDDTVTLAIATRDFTVNPYTQGETTAANNLANEIIRAAHRSSAADSPKHARWKGISIPQVVHGQETTSSTQAQDDSTTLSLDPRTSTQDSTISSSQAEVTGSLAGMYSLANHGSAYGFGPDEISHLVDCNKLINAAFPVLIIIAVFALVTGIITRIVAGRRIFGRALAIAPALLLAIMIALGIWALIDFYGFFSAFHGLFFPQGNWTFPYDSLLICMLPTPFWVGMAALWVVVTVGLSIVSVLLGRSLSRR